jgi:hypothetical protein
LNKRWFQKSVSIISIKNWRKTENPTRMKDQVHWKFIWANTDSSFGKLFANNWFRVFSFQLHQQKFLSEGRTLNPLEQIPLFIWIKCFNSSRVWDLNFNYYSTFPINHKEEEKAFWWKLDFSHATQMKTSSSISEDIDQAFPNNITICKSKI